MKRMYRFFTFLAILSVFFTSCKKQITEVTEVTQVNEIKNPAIGVRYIVHPGDWQTDNSGISYTVSLEIPELADSIYNYGAVLTYLSFAGTDFYEALPEVFQGIAYGAIHSPGYVSVDYHALDGSELDRPATDIYVKVVLVPAILAKANPGVNFRNFKEVERVFLNK